MNRRKFLETIGAGSVGAGVGIASHTPYGFTIDWATPEATSFNPMQNAFQTAYRRYDMVPKQKFLNGEPGKLQLETWIIAFMNHPSARGSYRRVNDVFGRRARGGSYAEWFNPIAIQDIRFLGEDDPHYGEHSTFYAAQSLGAEGTDGMVAVISQGALVQIWWTHPGEDRSQVNYNDVTLNLIERVFERNPEMMVRGTITEEGVIASLPNDRDLLHIADTFELKIDRHKLILEDSV